MSDLNLALRFGAALGLGLLLGLERERKRDAELLLAVCTLFPHRLIGRGGFGKKVGCTDRFTSIADVVERF